MKSPINQIPIIGILKPATLFARLFLISCGIPNVAYIANETNPKTVP
jgi:hypothetical protein